MAETREKTKIAVVLAAGQGTRMKSDLPKVLHPLLGEPMATYPVRALEEAGVGQILMVLGKGADQVEQALSGRIVPVYQEEQLGTGHALLMALPKLQVYQDSGGGECLVTYGDTPLIKGETLERLSEARAEAGAAAAILTAKPDDPAGLGRIIRAEDGSVAAIVEDRDADESQKIVNEINAGAFAFDIAWLAKALENLKPNNAQGEYYLTDAIAWLIGQGQKVASYCTPSPEEGLGVNDRLQLSRAQDILRRRILERHMLNGVTIEEPSATIIGPFVEIGRDTVVETGCQIFGHSVIGEACAVGPRCRIIDCRIGDGTKINQTTALECEIGALCDIGPFAYMRPGCVLADKVKVGAFVEMKLSSVGTGTKVPHLSYVGDSSLGSGANIGAGTITCNYDGVDHHQTIIGDGAFIGSNSNLVAPVVIGEGAYTAAGSTITQDVPPFSLGIARGRQSNIIDWRKRK
ncbi:MAG: bifunctional UDP-N-acetylglucosamine diphosphorylase/glucosamine-1-phosphate N-acetyltransferase GlmU [Clostridiales bacterium]|nr:bifunctional UDP-N-acetylglucosamine diphosphorylase/glucosamine-1-phosphate N-acetyltransferase GlmU [Clostridiales bacterium]